VEAFESFVAVALEAEGFVVSEAVKFPVTLLTAKAAYEESQTHGFEVDLVGARSDRLVLASVKSFFGSRGVVSDDVIGTTPNQRRRKRYALLNDPSVRRTVIATAAKRYGYKTRQVQVRLYVGRFAAPKSGTHERAVREWASKQRAGGGPIQVLSVNEVVDRVREAASHKQYRDNAVLVTMKVLEAAGLLNLKLPEDIGDG
jgi:hypothetical protein